MANPSPYRSLPAARRVTLVMHALTATREARAVYIQRMVARGGGFRAATLQGWSNERLAREVVRMNAESAEDELDLLQLLYVELEPAIQRTFFDSAGVRHDGGKLAEGLTAPYADEASVRRGAAVVRERHGEDGARYLRTLARYARDVWPGIEEIGAAG